MLGDRGIEGRHLLRVRNEQNRILVLADAQAGGTIRDAKLIPEGEGSQLPPGWVCQGQR